MSFQEKSPENQDKKRTELSSLDHGMVGKGPDFTDNRSEAAIQRKQAEMANSSPQVNNMRAFQDNADASPQVQQVHQLQKSANSGINSRKPGIQRKENNTGLPDNLKAGVENLSGYSMDDVKVHYNSDQPAQLQADAYAQGSDIHLGPGQEKHLPHEAWHVVQQKQGRVNPTVKMKGGVNVNDDAGLEQEADVMGGKALQMQSLEKGIPKSRIRTFDKEVVQNREVIQPKLTMGSRSWESTPVMKSTVDTVVGEIKKILVGHQWPSAKTARLRKAVADMIAEGTHGSSDPREAVRQVMQRMEQTTLALPELTADEQGFSSCWLSAILSICRASHSTASRITLLSFLKTIKVTPLKSWNAKKAAEEIGMITSADSNLAGLTSLQEIHDAINGRIGKHPAIMHLSGGPGHYITVSKSNLSEDGKSLMITAVAGSTAGELMPSTDYPVVKEGKDWILSGSYPYPSVKTISNIASVMGEIPPELAR